MLLKSNIQSQVGDFWVANNPGINIFYSGIVIPKFSVFQSGYFLFVEEFTGNPMAGISMGIASLGISPQIINTTAFMPPVNFIGIPNHTVFGNSNPPFYADETYQIVFETYIAPYTTGRVLFFLNYFEADEG